MPHNATPPALATRAVRKLVRLGGTNFPLHSPTFFGQQACPLQRTVRIDGGYEALRSGASDVPLKVLIEAILVRGGYIYAPRLYGEVLLTNSRDPEHAAARALVARGHAGNFWTVDEKTGRRRMLVEIGKAARLTVTESDRRGGAPRPTAKQLARLAGYTSELVVLYTPTKFDFSGYWEVPTQTNVRQKQQFAWREETEPRSS
jgi:hypothetical protein